MRSLRMAIALALVVAGALAQQATAPLPAFSERVEVRVLDIDVDVTDSKGQAVADLKREDFTLTIGGKPVPIDYFSRVDQGQIHAPDLASASPDQMMEVYTKGGETYIPRNFLIYIDLGYLPPGRRNASLNALRDMVTRLGPDDAARVILFDRRPKVLADWTTSKETIFAALTSVEKGSVGMSRMQSQRTTLALIDSTPRRRGGSGATGRSPLVQQYAQETGSEIETMLESMQNELVTLTPLSGKKAFLFVTGGFEFQPGYVMGQYASGAFGPSTITNLNIRQIPERVNALVERANGFAVSFYTVDGLGLTNEVGASGDSPVGTNAHSAAEDPLGSRAGLSFAYQQDRQNGMQIMAADTGGLALLNTNDFQGGLSRIYQAASTYYSLGVSLSKLGITKYEQVRVTVNRRGVTLRAQRGYLPLSEAQVVSDRAMATMETDLSYNAIPVTLQTAPATPEKKLYVLPVTVTIPASALTFTADGQTATARAEIYVGATDDKGGKSPLSRQEAAFQIPADKAAGNTPLHFDARLQTKKGNYRITVNVRDSVTGKMGTARANVRVE